MRVYTHPRLSVLMCTCVSASEYQNVHDSEQINHPKSPLFSRDFFTPLTNCSGFAYQGIVVDKDFSKVLEEIQAERMFFVRFDSSLPLLGRRESKVDPENIFNIDPMRILFFMKEHLRTIDLFLKIDQNKDGFLTREEMKYAFEVKETEGL